MNTVGAGQNGEARPGPSPTTEGNGPESLRKQAQELIDEILADTSPEHLPARNRLLDCISNHPGKPEAALLEHLMNRPTTQGPSTKPPEK